MHTYTLLFCTDCVNFERSVNLGGLNSKLEAAVVCIQGDLFLSACLAFRRRYIYFLKDGLFSHEAFFPPQRDIEARISLIAGYFVLGEKEDIGHASEECQVRIYIGHTQRDFLSFFFSHTPPVFFICHRGGKNLFLACLGNDQFKKRRLMYQRKEGET